MQQNHDFARKHSNRSVDDVGACLPAPRRRGLQAISPLPSSFAEATEDGSRAPVGRSPAPAGRRPKFAPITA
jgi:hypothetical protein